MTLQPIFSLANELSEDHPKQLAFLQAIFMQKAARNIILPIDDRTIKLVNPTLASRPDQMAGRTSITLADDKAGMTENVFLNI